MLQPAHVVTAQQFEVAAPPQRSSLPSTSPSTATCLHLFSTCTHWQYILFPFQRSCCTPGKNKMSSLYEDFLQIEGNWRNSMVYKSIKRTSRNGRRGIRRWLTRSQMLVIFDSTSIVDSIIARKETDEYLKSTEIREHPDCPGTGMSVAVQSKSFSLFSLWPYASQSENIVISRRPRAVPGACGRGGDRRGSG